MATNRSFGNMLNQKTKGSKIKKEEKPGGSPWIKIKGCK